MKNKKFYAILMVAIMVIVGGCGKQVETNNNTEDTVAVVENTNVTEESDINNVENESSNDNEVADETQGFNPAVTEKDDSELNLKDYRYYLEDKSLATKENVFEEAVFSLVESETYFLTTEQIPLYATNGVRNGYIKENIDVSIVATCGDWCYFYLGSDKKYARLSDIEAGSMNSEEIEAMRAEEDTKTQAQGEKTTSTTETQSEVSSVQETIPDATVEEPVEVPATSDKYTPEEAIAVYREILEAGGITWDPSLKDVSSWGTGFFYLDKGYPEWAAQSSLESAAYGDGVKHFLDKYYLEVTGSDEDCVYFTSWHN